MRFFKFILFFITAISLQASQYNIILFSTIKVYNKDKKKFLNRFPNGIIEKQKKYYVFKISHLKNYSLAKKTVKYAKRYYKDAFIVKDSSITKNPAKQRVVENVKNQPIKSLPLTQMSQKESATLKTSNAKNSKNIYTTGFIQKNIAQESPTKPIKLNNYDMDKKNYHIPLTSRKISTTNNTPKLDEPKVLEEYQIPKPYKTVQNNKYDILNLTKYINALFNYNDANKESFYQKKIDYILSEIKKDRYNFDVYINSYLRTGTSVSTNGTNIEGNGRYTNAGISLNANKLLYDGQYWLTNHTYDILYKRLSEIKEINAKERLSLLGTSIYTDMYAAQEKLNMYEKIIKKHKYITKIIDEGYKTGKNSILDYIGAHSDYINLQRAILDATYKYRYSDYILRHSIKSRSKKPFKLYPAKISLQTHSLKVLQKEALRQSSDVAIQSNILKLKETDLKRDERRYYPTINFTSNIGYGLSKDDTFSLSGAGRGTFWSLGLTAKMPIFQRGDIILSKERDRYNILKQRSVFSAKQRAILIRIEKSYNEIKRLEQQKQFLNELLKLSLKKLHILTERYISGVSPYKEYSNALSSYLKYNDQLINIEQNYINEVSLLSVLTGKKKFYEQN